MPRPLRYVLYLVLLAVFLGGLIYNVTWHPSRHEHLPVSCNAKDAAPPTLVPGQALKVMTWNIQYLAGKRYVFWYDMADGSGPDEKPTTEDIAYNLDEVVRVIRDEQPDIVLLQEVSDGAKNTGYSNQLALLLERVTDLYPCSSEAFDWKADFVPDRHIFGSVGMKLATLSRYRMDKAERLQLPAPADNLIARQFAPKPALLVSYLPLPEGGQLAVVNTRLSGFQPGDDSQAQQVEAVARLLESLDQRGIPWIAGGDFNLLPEGQYQRLPVEQRSQYPADSPLQSLWHKYPMIPANAEANGEDRRQWYTRFPNDPRVSGPDRTVDYLFHSPILQRVDAQVRQDDTLLISDHLPLIARFLLPAGE
ncbi:endonuclease/exonuclease/phosphatase family protein [Pseudomonas sp. NPDC090202]|uniref:endonuclease/exonuclease/phosphatase family protein n=1 Tax=unclassified Pseudomonas TaxID=196821 RepID=UPI003819ABFF